MSTPEDQKNEFPKPEGRGMTNPEDSGERRIEVDAIEQTCKELIDVTKDGAKVNETNYRKDLIKNETQTLISEAKQRGLDITEAEERELIEKMEIFFEEVKVQGENMISFMTEFSSALALLINKGKEGLSMPTSLRKLSTRTLERVETTMQSVPEKEEIIEVNESELTTNISEIKGEELEFSVEEKQSEGGFTEPEEEEMQKSDHVSMGGNNESDEDVDYPATPSFMDRKEDDELRTFLDDSQEDESELSLSTQKDPEENANPDLDDEKSEEGKNEIDPDIEENQRRKAQEALIGKLSPTTQTFDQQMAEKNMELGRKDQKIEELKKTADRRFKGVVAIGILALLSTGYGVFTGRQKQEVIEQKEGELQNALKEKETLLANIALVQSQYESVQSRFSDALNANAAMGEETARLRGEIEKIMKVLEAKDQEILTKTGELRVLMDRLAEVVRESDKLQLRIQEQNRQMEILKIQLESGSIDPIEVDTAEKIAALRAELEQKSNELAVVSGQLEAQNLLLTENMKTIEFLNERIETLSNMVEVQAKNLDEQRAELDRLRELDPSINGIARHVQLINKFRAGEELTTEEKEYLIDYYEERVESMQESYGMVLREASNQLSRSLEGNSAMYRRSTAGNTNSAEVRQAMADLQMANDAASIAYKLTMSTYWDERREAEAELKLLKTLDK